MCCFYVYKFNVFTETFPHMQAKTLSYTVYNFNSDHFCKERITCTPQPRELSMKSYVIVPSALYLYLLEAIILPLFASVLQFYLTISSVTFYK